MLHFLNKNLRAQVILLVGLLAWSVFTIFTSMTLCPIEGKTHLFTMLAGVMVKNALAMKLTAIVLLTVSAIGIVRHFNKQRFDESRTLMPGIFFLALMNFGHLLDTFNPSFFTIMALSTVMMIFTPGAAPARMKDNILTFGLIVSTATLVDFSAFGIVLFLVFIIATNSVTPMKDTIILLSGLVLPYVVAFSVFFLCGGTDGFISSWRQMEFIAPIKAFNTLSPMDYAALAYFMAAVVVFWFRGRNYFENKLIMLRQAFTGLHLQFVSMAVFMIAGCIPLMPAIAYLTPSVAEYMSVSVIKKRRRFVYDAVIAILFVLLWL